MANRYEISEKNKHRYFDTIFILVLFLILVTGLVMLYSASWYEGSIKKDDSLYFIKRQLVSTAVGLGFMVIAAFWPYRFWLKTALIVYGIAALLLLLVIPYGSTINGAKRWIVVFGISIQPAEIAKLAIIIAVAGLIVKIGPGINTWKGLMVCLSPCIPLALMIYFITDNLSSAIIVVSINAIMCFVASSDYKKFLLLLLGVASVAALAIFIIVKSAGTSMSFRAERILAWLDPNAYASGKGYQTLQALYAIGSGGYMGKGIGQSMQKMGRIPEPHNDMIFAIICEEIGFVGAVCIILMFLLLLWRCLIIANNATDLYGSLLVVGFMAHIAVQVFLNIAVVTNTIPNTGISLPFISYGGCSVLFLLIEVGLVLSVQRSIKVREI